ncbi:MAG: sulfatase-like hydrolase/transferase [Arenicella sp.]|nr:sulfatase-like hydrolase/transferase [Arenicella sp.]
MKKPLLLILLIAIFLGGLAWLNKVPLLLAMASYQADKKYADRQPFVQVPWQQGPAVATVSASARPPNIILIVADDLGFNDISTFGGGVADGRIKTPNIDKLAAEGVVFEQSYSGHNTCAPSRAMLMTGRYSGNTGFQFTPTPPGMIKIVNMVSGSMDNGLPRAPLDLEAEKLKPPYEQMGLPGSETTIAEVLRDNGYYTAHVGKWHLGRSAGFTPQDQGFDDSLFMMSGLYLPEDSPDVVNARLDFDPIDQFLWSSMRYSAGFNETLGAGFTPGGYLTDYYTDESIRVIEANKQRPFFLYLAHWGVHTPLQATREDYEAVGDIKPHRLRVYAAMIRALDRSVGRVMQALENEGLADNTIVMFTSDNGGPGYLGLPGINRPFRGWKITSFEGGLRVPMFVKWPARLPAGMTIKQPVAHIDVMPTIAAAAGAELPVGVEIDGENILQLTNEATADEWQRETLYWVSDHSQVVRHGDWKLQLNDRRATDGLQKWLYNLSEDPTEQKNLAAARPDKLAELEALLAAHEADSRAPLWPAAAQLAVPIDKTLAEQFVDGDEYVFSPN